MAVGKSLHAGQHGVVVSDWGMTLLIKAEDESYAKAYTDSTREGKHFVVDTDLIIQKETI